MHSWTVLAILTLFSFSLQQHLIGHRPNVGMLSEIVNDFVTVHLNGDGYRMWDYRYTIISLNLEKYIWDAFWLYQPVAYNLWINLVNTIHYTLLVSFYPTCIVAVRRMWEKGRTVDMRCGLCFCGTRLCQFCTLTMEVAQLCGCYPLFWCCVRFTEYIYHIYHMTHSSHVCRWNFIIWYES